MTNLIARCHAATGSYSAAALLMRIAYWMPKATIEVGGEVWIAKPAAEWRAETGGMSAEQYKTAIACLRRLRLVITEQHLFYGRNVTHLRLTWRGLLAVGQQTSAEGGQKTPPGKGQTPLGEGLQTPPVEGPPTPPEWGQNPPLITRRYNKEIQQGDTTGVLPHAVGPRNQEKRIPGEESKPVQTGKPMQTGKPNPSRKPYLTKDVPPGGSPKPGSPGSGGKAAARLHQPQQVAGLETVWKQTMAEVTGSWVVPLTVKQKGQLKHFMQACPPGQAARVLELVLRDWVTFAVEAQADAGVKSSPDKPDIGFMLKHVATAVALHFAQKSGPLASGPLAPGQGLPQQPPQADLQLIAGSPAKPPAEPPAEPPAKPAVAYQPATKAEVMAALGIETPPPRPRSSIGVGRGAASRPSSSRP